MSKKPCKECPFNKKANLTKDNLGNSEPEVYLGQLNAPFWLPCHLDKNYKDKESDINKVSVCIGAGMLRSKLPVKDKFNSPDYTPIIEDNNHHTFDSCADFISHYKSISLEEAEALTTDDMINKYVAKEYFKASIVGKLYKK
jgi:hypothetical protein